MGDPPTATSPFAGVDDAYIVLHTKDGKAKDGLKHDIHYWLGREASQEKLSTVAIFVADLNRTLGGNCAEYRQLQGKESSDFGTMFKNGVIHIAKAPTSRSEPADSQRSMPVEPKLFQLQQTRGKPPKLEAARLSISSLNSRGSFIFERPGHLAVWTGKYVPEKMQTKLRKVMQRIGEARGGDPEITFLQEGGQDDATMSFYCSLGAADPNSVVIADPWHEAAAEESGDSEDNTSGFIIVGSSDDSDGSDTSTRGPHVRSSRFPTSLFQRDSSDGSDLSSSSRDLGALPKQEVVPAVQITSAPQEPKTPMSKGQTEQVTAKGTGKPARKTGEPPKAQPAASPKSATAPSNAALGSPDPTREKPNSPQGHEASQAKTGEAAAGDSAAAAQKNAEKPDVLVPNPGKQAAAGKAAGKDQKGEADSSPAPTSASRAAAPAEQGTGEKPGGKNPPSGSGKAGAAVTPEPAAASPATKKPMGKSGKKGPDNASKAGTKPQADAASPRSKETTVEMPSSKDPQTGVGKTAAVTKSDPKSPATKQSKQSSGEKPSGKTSPAEGMENVPPPAKAHEGQGDPSAKDTGPPRSKAEAGADNPMVEDGSDKSAAPPSDKGSRVGPEPSISIKTHLPGKGKAGAAVSTPASPAHSQPNSPASQYSTSSSPAPPAAKTVTSSGQRSQKGILLRDNGAESREVPDFLKVRSALRRAGNLTDDQTKQRAPASPSSNVSTPSASAGAIETGIQEELSGTAPLAAPRAVTPKRAVTISPSSQTFSYEELRRMKADSGIDMERKEEYLSSAEFQQVLGCLPEEFAKLPRWKQISAKKAKSIF